MLKKLLKVLLIITLLTGNIPLHAAPNPGVTTDIIVQFNTPPSVVLRHQARGRTRSEDFAARARAAHSTFRGQLGQLRVPRGLPLPEILSEYYTLFNGVTMRVPVLLAEAVAQLPEVYAVFPDEVFVPAYTAGPMPTSPGSIAPVNPLLLAEARQLFDMDYIHNELGLTGRGVRVAVIDTGIEHAHPEFARFLTDGMVPGHDFYANPNPTHHHGTLVSGALVAIAPGIELYNYRIAMQGTTGGSAIGAITRAHADGARIINMSFGAADSIGSPIGTAAANAVLDGVVVIASAGNSGPAASTITTPASQPSILAVGAGTAGGRNMLGDNVWASSSRGPTLFTNLPKPDILAPGAGIFTTTFGGYTAASGTSLAAPIVSGIAALMLEARPDMTPQEIMAQLKFTARPLEVESANNINASGSGFVVPLAAFTLLPGDVNGDGTADSLDIYVLRRYLAGLESDIVIANADINRDGEVNILDLTALRFRMGSQG